MFGQNNALQSFSLGRTKITYLITEALAPYFKNEQRKRIEDSYFTLLYDETTNAAGRKELHIAIRYWCESMNSIVTQHLETFFIGKSRADDICMTFSTVGRWEDFCVVLEKYNFPFYHFLRHVPQRWLTIEDAGKRALLLWTATKYYFFEYILREKKDKTLMESLAYRRIANLLKRPTMKEEVMFVVLSANIFTSVTSVFQREEPLIHLLYSELKNLIKILIGRCKNTNLAYDEIFKGSNLLQPDKVVVDKTILDELDRCGDSVAKIQFLEKASNHYVSACQYILEKSSLQSKNNILRSVRCLHPSERQKSYSISAIMTAAKALPFEIQTDILTDEWKLLQEEKYPETDISKIRIDVYWSYFFTLKNSFGNIKYPIKSQHKNVVCKILIQ
ncbi:hypothetical protein ALC62_12639 [Cyphomyrmex costatus]|uniref:DUF4371 domain-containing protein n=1 Tax=Cyphomyrmex costatus TaxID=456900 RepID=A0A151IAW3_9HYME|nr:hypothetical protein ALC62_12639 [Cyphomyrmex costatus]